MIEISLCFCHLFVFFPPLADHGSSYNGLFILWSLCFFGKGVSGLQKGFCVHKNCLIPPLFTQPFFWCLHAIVYNKFHHIMSSVFGVCLRSRKRQEAVRLSLLQHDYWSNNDIVASPMISELSHQDLKGCDGECGALVTLRLHGKTWLNISCCIRCKV